MTRLVTALSVSVVSGKFVSGRRGTISFLVNWEQSLIIISLRLKISINLISTLILFTIDILF
jgi:hypothetical protein